MNSNLFFLASGFGLGLTTGLWLGFKLWRQTYVQIDGRRGRWL